MSTRHDSPKDNGAAFLRHQVKMLVNLNLNPYLAVLLTVSCLAYIVTPYVSPLRIFGWLALVLICQQWRRVYIARILHSPATPDAQSTMRALVRFSFLNGCAVGLSSPLFFADIPDFARAGITVLLVGLVSGSSAAAAAYLPIFIAYILPALLPLAFCWAIAGSETLLIGALVLLLIGVLLGFARETQRMLIESFGIRFEHEQLVQALERKHGEVLEAKEKAVQAGQAKARVLAAASHDLRQPLHALSLYSAVLASSPTQQTLTTVAQHIDLSVRALGALLNALLDLSRLDAGVFQVKSCLFDASEVLARVCKDFESPAKNKGLTLTLQAAPSMVNSDPIVFERIARNLIDNAIKYTDLGGVTVSLSEIDSDIEIAVSDSGKGIAAMEQQRIFEEFYQLHNAGRDRDQGLGLGLSIVQRLAGLVGSSIHLKSDEGQGSTFSWRLPLADNNTASQAAIPATEAAIPQIRPGARILIIDDEAAIRHGMQLLLERWGAQTYLASDGAQAHHIMSKLSDVSSKSGNQPVDLIIADLRLKDGVDGLQTALALRQRWGAISVLLASGETDPTKLKDVAASGFTLLHKPVSPETLRQNVAQLLVNGSAVKNL